MRRFDRLGIVETNNYSMKYVIGGIENSLSHDTGYEVTSANAEVVLESLLSTYRAVLLLENLEVEHPFDVRDVLRKGADAAVDYFFGSWRDAYRNREGTWNRQECREKLAWIDPYLHSLFILSCLGDMNIIHSLATFPDVDLRSDDVDYKLVDKYYYIVLSRLIRELDIASSQELITQIEQGRGRRAKLLLQATLDLFQDKQKAFRKSLERFVVYYRKQVFDPLVFITYASEDASILWHLARLRGMEIHPFESDLMDMIVTLNLAEG